MTQTQSDDLVTRLLPCPFCGHGSPSVWLYRENRKSPVEPQWVAHCKGCNITQKRRRAASAVEAWNTRAVPAEAAAEIQRLKAQVAVAREAVEAMPDDIDWYRFVRSVKPRTNAAIGKAAHAYLEPIRAALASIEGAAG